MREEMPFVPNFNLIFSECIFLNCMDWKEKNNELSLFELKTKII